MVATTTATPQIIKSHDTPNGGNEVSRKEIQAAIAKVVELRGLHATLIQGNGPANFRFPTSYPPSHRAFSAQDYPIFTPIFISNPNGGVASDKDEIEYVRQKPLDR
ncbi:unnamed protein product [Ilex paraguariensis]|uniref:Uncharacterized protein n=1 Tax=Ilex paraguariensis TaxID=185542 RepID=A0ABC8TV16_9AQUA